MLVLSQISVLNESSAPRFRAICLALPTGRINLFLFFFAKWILRFLSRRPSTQVGFAEEACTARSSNARPHQKSQRHIAADFLAFSHTSASLCRGIGSQS